MDPKPELRRLLRATIRAISASQRTAASQATRLLLDQQSEWRDAASIFFYAPLGEELDIWPLLLDTLAAQKTVCLPRFDSRSQRYVPCRIQNIEADIAIGQFSLREPAPHCPAVPLNQLDLILVPGIGFDTRGNRLGRGKGFYDRLLTAVRGTKCGVAFDEQIVPSVPVEAHDVTLDRIVTPTRWIDCRRLVLE